MQKKKPNSTWVVTATFWVLTLTLVAIVWYTIETTRLRMATEEQIRRSYMPIIVMEFKDRNFITNDGFNLKPVLRNIGFGPAFNIEISPLRNEDREVDFDLVPGLGKDAEYELMPFASQLIEGQQAVDNFGELLTKAPRSAVTFNVFPVVIRYLDSKGEMHKVTQEIQVKIDKHEVQAVVKEMPSPN